MIPAMCESEHRSPNSLPLVSSLQKQMPPSWFGRQGTCNECRNYLLLFGAEDPRLDDGRYYCLGCWEIYDARQLRAAAAGGAPHRPATGGPPASPLGHLLMPDRDFVYVSPTDAGPWKELECAVCTSPWIQPLEVLPCRHIFCAECCRQTLIAGAGEAWICCVCRAPVTHVEAPNRVLANIVDALLVRCAMHATRGVCRALCGLP